MAADKIIAHDIKIVEDVSLGTMQVNASGGTGGTVDISASVPTGYKAVAAIPRMSGSYGIYFYSCIIEGLNTVTVQLFRVTGTVTSTNPRVAIICQRI